MTCRFWICKDCNRYFSTSADAEWHEKKPKANFEARHECKIIFTSTDMTNVKPLSNNDDVMCELEEAEN